ncbi:MAG: histidine kinase [Ignavibacteria bacterium]
MPESAMLSKRWVKWGLIFFVWSLLAVFFVTQNFIYSINTDKPFDWGQALSYRLSSYWIWALLTPLVLLIADKYKLEKKYFPKNILMLLFFGILISVFQSFMTIFLFFAFSPYSVKPPIGLLAQLGNAKFGVMGGSFDSFFMYCIILSIIYSFDYYKKNREQQYNLSQLESKLAQAELQSLKMQLQPHFLFNSLHAISTLMHRDADAADKMITRLSDLLRISLDNIGVQEVTLKDELEFLEQYIEIQKIRFQDTLTVNMNIAPETLNVMVPNLILQPIVENAFKHGVEMKSSKRIIDISSALNNGTLELKVQDNGPGINNNSGSIVKEGVGLNNTRARLDQIYGKDYEIIFKDAEKGGLLVCVNIPHNLKSTSVKDA